MITIWLPRGKIDRIEGLVEWREAAKTNYRQDESVEEESFLETIASKKVENDFANLFQW